MPKDVRIWEVHREDELAELKPAKLDLENRIESWLEQDISIISDDLLVIGRQVGTTFGGGIDLLCLDSNGDTVIVELKRDKTPRDITAQVLDYASWVQDLSGERITELANQYLGEQGPLEQAFEQKFEEELPETLNGHHKMLVVASEVDASTERILNYLSDTYGVDINAVTFQYFHHAGEREFLARVFLIEPSQVEYSARTKSTSKRRQRPSFASFRETAEDKGVGEIYTRLFRELRGFFDTRSRTQSSVTLIGEMNGKRNTIFSILPGGSSEEKGLRFRVFINRLAQYFDAPKDELVAALPSNTKDYAPWNGAPPCVAGYFRSQEDVTQFLTYLLELQERD
jgi:hypothetical protein